MIHVPSIRIAFSRSPYNTALEARLGIAEAKISYHNFICIFRARYGVRQ